MELKVIIKAGFSLGERVMFLDGNTLLCQYCGDRVWWRGELVDFSPLGFDHMNRKISCVRCGKETYYDVKELEKHDVNFVDLWVES